MDNTTVKQDKLSEVLNKSNVMTLVMFLAIYFVVYFLIDLSNKEQVQECFGETRTLFFVGSADFPRK